MTARARVDAELVRRGLARSRRHAAELVGSGRVTVGGRMIVKPSAPVPDAAEVVVAPGDPGEAEYVSRAGLKLAGALDALAGGVPTRDALVRDASTRGASAQGTPAQDPSAPGAPAVDGMWCADLGASTGGFTDVLLRRGAEHVVAIDVGHGQLAGRLREDPRVTAVEGKNVRDLTSADLDRAPGLVTGDLSFISLTLVLPAIAAVLPPQGNALLLVKPQFEVGRKRLGRGGVVRDPAQHAEAITAVVRAAEQEGLRLRAIVPSHLPGPSGNREFFAWFVSDAAVPVAGERELAGAVAAAVAPGGSGRPGPDAPGHAPGPVADRHDPPGPGPTPGGIPAPEPRHHDQEQE